MTVFLVASSESYEANKAGSDEPPAGIMASLKSPSMGLFSRNDLGKVKTGSSIAQTEKEP